jgi:AcrR family transcriptional regulator
MLATSSTPRFNEIVDAARELLEADGSEAVTMRAVAGRVGIRAASLYKHLPDKDALETALVARGFEEIGEVFEAAVDGAPDPLAAIAAAYRGWALDHPHYYRLMTAKAIDRDQLPAGVEARGAAPLVAACGGNGDRARAAWAFAHGMAILEIAGRFPPDADLDAAWRAGVDAFRPPRSQRRSTS